MILTLIQLKQNALYDFSNPQLKLSDAETAFLVNEMIEQNMSLMESAPDSDMIVTTEAINYPSVNTSEALDDTLLQRIMDFAKRRKCYVAVGLLASQNNAKQNMLFVINPNGRIEARYAKVHLTRGEKEWLIPGNEYCSVNTPFGAVGLSICWDMQFPEVCRHYAIHDVPLVICPTWGWESLYAQARAYENGIYIAGAMSVPYNSSILGVRSPSQVIAPDGRIVAEAVYDCACTLSADVDLSLMRELRQLRLGDRRPHTYLDLVR